jgi:hypothetical protein
MVGCCAFVLITTSRIRVKKMTTGNNPAKLKPSPTDLTVEQFCNYIAPGVWDHDTLLTWPPDVFAVVASLLLKSGAYCYAVSGWKRKPSLKQWVKDIKRDGESWRDNPNQPPAKVRRWHHTLIAKQNRNIPISKVRNRPKLCEALLQLSAAADEACGGVGLAMLSQGKANAFLGEASQQLWKSAQTLGVSTLCKQVHHSVIRVLPKLHTPQSGITIRSLTHNLALCPAGDVKATWSERIRPPRNQHCLNLLLVPWPRTVNPSHIQCVNPGKAELRDMPKRFGFFEYQPPRDADDLPGNLKKLLRNARRVVPQIHGVVFPELALTRTQYETISADLIRQDVFLICGVREAGKNYVRFDIPVDIPVGRSLRRKKMWHQQNKHHRWRLDKRQIVQYGLGSCLNVEWKWWEHISIKERELCFVALDDWLTVCALICEDLARQDPVAEVVRAVGPNLVIALLMDGPQLNSRWPARYATVLADDPGSSVLTLTSVGMCELSRPPSIQERSRAVALWKDAKTGEAVRIDLPQNADGVVLSLSCVFRNEWTADGRDDAHSTGYPTLSGIHYVTSDKSRVH